MQKRNAKTENFCIIFGNIIVIIANTKIAKNHFISTHLQRQNSNNVLSTRLHCPRDMQYIRPAGLPTGEAIGCAEILQASVTAMAVVADLHRLSLLGS